MARANLSGVSFPNSAGAATQTAAPQTALSLGVAGTIPASAAADTSDFFIIVPCAMTITRLKAVCKTAPSSNTTIQLRKSTDSGSTWADVTGFSVTVNASALVGTADPTDTTVNEGDLLGFSVTAGGGSGTNLMLEVVAVPR